MSQVLEVKMSIEGNPSPTEERAGNAPLIRWKSRVLNTIRENGEMSDAALALEVGVGQREFLRRLLAELAIDGKIVAQPARAQSLRENGGAFWMDGEGAWLVRLAPAGTPSLEDRIVGALAEAGIDGLGFDDVVDIVHRGIAPLLPSAIARAAHGGGDARDRAPRGSGARCRPTARVLR